MKYTPDGYGERCRFDAFCKTVLRNEARTHLRDLGRQRNREIEFSALSQQEMDKLCTVDEYPSDSFLFTAYGNPKRVFSKKEIYDYAWDDLYIGEDRTINVHVSNIRQKIKAFSDKEYIETVWGVGFKLAD